MTPRHTQEQDLTAWHLDKRIPIAMIFTIIIQTGVAVWWVSNLSHRVDTATSTNAQQDNRISAMEAGFNNQQVGMATAAAELRAMRESLTEVKSALTEQTSLLREILTNGKKP